MGTLGVEDFAKGERLRDERLCGSSLDEPSATRFGENGAHDPTASHYFVLEDLFPRLGLSEDSRILDVGCGAGRVLVFFGEKGFPGSIDGVELDPALASRAWKAARGCPRSHVMQGSALDVALGGYTHFYLFNPFDSWVLERFVEKLESDVSKARAEAGWVACDGNGPEGIILCHASDNGEGYFFMGRPGWRLREEGFFQDVEGVRVFDYPQHWSIWEYRPIGAAVSV